MHPNFSLILKYVLRTILYLSLIMKQFGTLQCIRRLLSPPSETACLRRLEEFCKHLELFPWAKGLAVREAAVGVVLNIRRRTNNDSVKIQVAETLSRLGYEDPFKGESIGILGCCIQPLSKQDFEQVVGCEFLQ